MWKCHGSWSTRSAHVLVEFLGHQRLKTNIIPSRSPTLFFRGSYFSYSHLRWDTVDGWNPIPNHRLDGAETLKKNGINYQSSTGDRRISSQHPFLAPHLWPLLTKTCQLQKCQKAIGATSHRWVWETFCFFGTNMSYLVARNYLVTWMISSYLGDVFQPT